MGQGPRLAAPTSPYGSSLGMRIWGAFPDFVQERVNAFQQAYGTKVDLNVVGGDYPSIVQNLLQQKQTVDMAYSLTHVLAAWQKAGWLVDFDRFWAREEAEKQMLPSVREAATVNGKLMGLPYFAFVHGMMLANTEVLQKAGLSGEWPKTYTELYEQARKIKKSGASDVPYLPFWITSFAGIPWGFVQEALNRNIPLFGDNGEPRFDEKSEAVEMLQQWRALYAEGLVPRGILTFQESDFAETFAKGGIAYASHLQFYLKSLHNRESSGVAGKIVPVPRQGQNWGMLHAGLYVVGAPGKDDERLAHDFLLAQHFGFRDQKTNKFEVPLSWAKTHYLTQGYAEVNNDPEVTKSVSQWLPDPETNLPILTDSLENAQYPKGLFHSVWALRWLTYAAQELPKAVNGDESPAKVVKNLRTKADELMEQFGS
ncbi:ABC transporter substrate-binding protein [Micromonospora sp. NPDC005305]|uniref:ABC transporter substrate-binding protein n=1 Tax=Micromonospora sp. NPDC005305 TaxID=3156875 RepID=UPI0033AADA40